MFQSNVYGLLSTLISIASVFFSSLYVTFSSVIRASRYPFSLYLSTTATRSSLYFSLMNFDDLKIRIGFRNFCFLVLERAFLILPVSISELPVMVMSLIGTLHNRLLQPCLLCFQESGIVLMATWYCSIRFFVFVFIM